MASAQPVPEAWLWEHYLSVRWITSVGVPLARHHHLFLQPCSNRASLPNSPSISCAEQKPSHELEHCHDRGDPIVIGMAKYIADFHGRYGPFGVGEKNSRLRAIEGHLPVALEDSHSRHAQDPQIQILKEDA